MGQWRTIVCAVGWCSLSPLILLLLLWLFIITSSRLLMFRDCCTSFHMYLLFPSHLIPLCLVLFWLLPCVSVQEKDPAWSCLFTLAIPNGPLFTLLYNSERFWNRSDGNMNYINYSEENWLILQYFDEICANFKHSLISYQLDCCFHCWYS